jgi:hypothetical protein
VAANWTPRFYPRAQIRQGADRLSAPTRRREGIVSKRKDSAYRSGRSPDWLKMKNCRGGLGQRPVATKISTHTPLGGFTEKLLELSPV